jgi:hypothetical protein
MGGQTMTYNELLGVLAPCGLNCKRCISFNEGDIRLHSMRLKELLGAFDSYAERFSEFWPVFSQYQSFKEILDCFCDVSCRGCRSGDCRYPGCGVSKCHTEKKIDFCFQCNEFPCEKSNLDDHLKKRWISMNSRMKEIGVEHYYEETKDKPRYI